MPVIKERLPFLPVDVDRLTSDELVEAMTTEEFGAYFLLLCKAWKSDPPCSIPNDDATLARWSRVDLKTWNRIRTKVLAPWKQSSDGRLYQKRLLVVYKDVMEKVAKKKEAGAKGGKSKASKKNEETLKNDPKKASTATAQVEHSYDSASVLLVANGKQTPSKDKDKDKGYSSFNKEEPHTPTPLSEISTLPFVDTRNPRIPMAESQPDPDPAIHGIEIDGNLVMYTPGDTEWTSAFVRWWNSLPGVYRWEFPDLDDAMKVALNQRLQEPLWFWKRTYSHFPLTYPDDRKTSISQFLTFGFVGKVLGGSYQKTNSKDEQNGKGRSVNNRGSTFQGTPVGGVGWG